MSSDQDALGILSSLADFSFSSFVTMKLIKVIYAIGFVLLALFCLSTILGGFSNSVLTGIGMLIVMPLVFVVTVMYLRVVLEVLAVIFRIAEDVRSLSGNADRAESLER